MCTSPPGVVTMSMLSLTVDNVPRTMVSGLADGESAAVAEVPAAAVVSAMAPLDASRLEQPPTSTLTVTAAAMIRCVVRIEILRIGEGKVSSGISRSERCKTRAQRGRSLVAEPEGSAAVPCEPVARLSWPPIGIRHACNCLRRPLPGHSTPSVHRRLRGSCSHVCLRRPAEQADDPEDDHDLAKVSGGARRLRSESHHAHTA